MSSRLIVDNANELRELNDQPKALKLVAKLISYVFHPVFVPVYIMLFLLYVHPTIFAGAEARYKMMTLMQAILMYCFFPVISILLLKALGFISSIYLVTSRDRIIPYAICMIWYFWICYVWWNLADTPKEIVKLSAGIFLASIVGWMANIYIKISMHAIAVGVMTGFMLFLVLKYPINAGVYMSLALLIAGLVCTSRFIASDHTAGEIYGGLLAGFASGILTALFLVVS